MGRPPRDTPAVKVTIHIPEDVYNRLHLIFLDSMSGRIGYGKLGSLITMLLRQWLNNERQIMP